MVPRRYGRIINIGSVTSVAGYAGLGPIGGTWGHSTIDHEPRGTIGASMALP